MDTFGGDGEFSKFATPSEDLKAHCQALLACQNVSTLELTSIDVTFKKLWTESVVVHTNL